MKPILHGHLDSALIDMTGATTTLELRGWFLREPDVIKDITFYYGSAKYNVLPVPRPDVAERVKSLLKTFNVGYEVKIPITFLPIESPTLTISFSIHFESGDVFDSYLSATPRFKKPSTSPSETTQSLTSEYVALTKIKLTNYLTGKEKLCLPNHNSPKVSVIIVNHNQAHLLLNCLSSLKHELPPESEVIIFDNASRDETINLLYRIDGAKIFKNSENLHFLKAANICALEALGEYLLFINSDIEVLPGAISEAISKIESEDKYGIIGATLISTNGKVQELGGLIFRDGVTSPLFADQDLDCAQQNFIDSVDYCSGAFMLVRRKLFQDLRGFQQQYEPAYYEDVDLCLRAKASGWLIGCSPKIMAVHVGRASAQDPNDPNQLIKQNQKKFFSLNKDLLSNPKFLNYKVKESLTFTKGILVFDDFLPLSSRGQGLPRSAKILSILEEKRIPINFAVSHTSETKYLELYRKYSARILSSEEELFRHLVQASSIPSIWWISRPPNLERVSKVLSKLPDLRSQIKIIYDSEAIYSTRLILEYELEKNIALSDNEILSIIEAEMKIVRQADTVIAVSQTEADTFKEFGITDVCNISYGIDSNSSNILPDYHDTTGLLFIGPTSGTNTPNADAAILTAQTIYPEFLKQIRPNTAGISYAGDITPAVCELLSGSNVHILGLVDQLAEVTKQHRILIVPHRFGSGIPIKVIEAAYAGIPIVCSELIAQQLGWNDNQEVLVGRTPEEIAVKAAALYGNIDLWRSIRNKAYETVIKQFSTDQFKSSIISLIERQEFKSHLGL